MSVNDIATLLFLSWHILMRMRAPKEEGSCDPIAPLELPHSLHAFRRVPQADELNEVTTFLLHTSYYVDQHTFYAFPSLTLKIIPEANLELCYKTLNTNKNGEYVLLIILSYFSGGMPYFPRGILELLQHW